MMNISSKKIYFLDRIIWSLFFIWLVVDDVTGFFINAGNALPISQLFKITVLILLIARLLSYKTQFVILYTFFLYISYLCLYLIFIDESVSVTLLHLSKLLLTVVIYIYLRVYYQQNNTHDFEQNAGKIFNLAFVLIALNIGIGIFDIGYHTYPDEGIGYKGFFFAGNELGGVLVVIFPYILYKTFVTYGLFKYACTSLGCIILAVLLGTKTVILISVFSALGIAWVYGSHRFRINLIISIGIIVLISIPFIIDIINSREVDILMRMSYSYDKGGLSSLVFSSRDEFWAGKSIEFFDSNIFVQLFGLGGNRSVEMDHLDALLNYGYVGLFFIYGFFLYLLMHAVRNRKNNNYCAVIIFTDVIAILISLIAGHIIFSSMAGLYIALQNSLTDIKTDKLLFVKLKA